MGAVDKILKYKNGSVRFIWQFILLLVVIRIFGFLASVPLQWLNLHHSKYVTSLAAEIIVLLAVFYLNHFMDKKHTEIIGLNFASGWYRQFAVGSAVAVALVTSIFLIELITGQVTIVDINRSNWVAIVGSGLILYLAVGLAEEAMNRGYAINKLLRGYSHPMAIVIAALVFAGLHLGNVNFSWLAFINTFIFGVLLGYMFVKTGSLWWPVGFHACWNLIEGVVYGLSTSGIIIKPIITLNLKSPGIINGGKYGPAGGLLGTVALLGTILVIWFKYRYKGEKI